MNIFASLRQKISHYSIKGKIITVLWITLIWTLIRLFRFFETYASNKDSIEFNEGIVSSILIIIVAGLFVGVSLVFLWERWLRRMAYFKAMFLIMVFFEICFCRGCSCLFTSAYCNSYILLFPCMLYASGLLILGL